MKRSFTRHLTLLLAMAFPLTALAVDTDLDTSWDGDGIAIAQVAPGNSFSNPTFADLHRTASGKLVMMTVVPTTNGLRMWRLNADGSTDTTFGGGDGVTEPLWASGDFHPFKSIRRADGLIAVVGWAGVDSNVCLVPVAGTVFSPTFGNDNGCFVHSFIPADIGFDHELYTDVVNLEDNGVLAAGYWSNDQVLMTTTGISLTRLDASGVPDPAFDGDGHLSLEWDDLYVRNAYLTRVRDGQVVVVFSGERYVPERRESLYALRINLADGSVDTSYGNNGLVTVDFEALGLQYTRVGARDAEVLRDGSVVAAVQLRHGDVDQWDNALDWVGVAKLRPDGTLDAGFGDAGGRTWFRFDELYAYERVADMTVDDQGRMLISVTISDHLQLATGGELAMARLRADGSMDTRFGGAGYWRLQLDRAGQNERNADLAMSTRYENGRLLLAALSDGPTSDFEPVVLGFHSALFRDGLEDPLLQPEP